MSFLLVFVSGPLAGQCSMCAEAVDNASHADGGSLAAGFYWSILFLLTVLFGLTGGLVGFIVFVARRESAAREFAAQAEKQSEANSGTDLALRAAVDEERSPLPIGADGASAVSSRATVGTEVSVSRE